VRDASADPTADAVRALARTAAGARQRRVIVVEGTAERVRARVSTLLAALDVTPGEALPWLGPARGPRPRELLGRDLAGAVLEGFAGYPADALGAVAGAIRAGGLLWLLQPPADAPAPGRFAARGAALLAADPRVLRLRITEAGETVEAPEAPRTEAEADATASTDPACATEDQATAVADILRALTGRARRPCVLVADRGRGKSAALGIAAARALNEVDGDLLVTAPSPAAVRNLFLHAARALGEAPPRDPQAPVLAGGRLRWVAPHALAAEPPTARAVLVDEAAALPVPLLDRFLARHGRIAFATTVHGYEGTGRGFELRFRARLDARTPAWRARRLETPVRWAPDDPLEALVARWLCLDAEAPAPPARPGRRVLRTVDAGELAEDEALLRGLFGLLVLAHYRTRPRDLVRLLDDPATRLLAAFEDGVPTGCVLTVDEGGLPPALARAVATGRRRPRGQHGAGILAAQLGLAAGATLPSRRIVRIVVHPARQRTGLGRALLEAAATDAGEAAFLSSSFGAEPGLVRFWRACGFAPIRLGTTRDAASGEVPVLVLRARTSPGTALLRAARATWLRELPFRLGDGDAVDEDLAAALLADAPSPPEDAARRRAVARWLRGEAPLENVGGAIAETLAGLPGIEGDLPALVARVVQHRPWSEIARRLGVTGRAEAEARLRAALARALGER
jgi:tRNA(Met) cytidine acetyltransferase